jgi:hypothetical protein
VSIFEILSYELIFRHNIRYPWYYKSGVHMGSGQMLLAHFNNRVSYLNFSILRSSFTDYHLVNFSNQSVDFSFFQMTPQDLRMIHIAYVNDLDAIVLAHYIPSTDWGVYFVELNKMNCHKNCEGCYKLNDENECLRCREGLRLVEGICTPKFIPCPSHMKENALGEC